jgi:hypothetical protein
MFVMRNHPLIPVCAGLQAEYLTERAQLGHSGTTADASTARYSESDAFGFALRHRTTPMQ